TALSGNLDLLEQQVRGDAARRLIEAAHRAIERGARLTQSLLAFARRQSLHPETVNANRLIKEFVELLRRAAGDHVEVQLLLSPTLDPCRIDAAQFQAALLNLIVNARDAVPASGGRISIETENVTVDEREAALDPGTQPGAFVCIKVSDTGSGMTQEVMTRAFEPFFTTKDIGKGSGLGLSQVYGFAAQSGGFVRLASELGIGTTVRLYLPRSQDGAAAEQQRSVGTAPSARAGRAETVLVVEDDADVRDTVTESLRALGYDVVAAEDGVAALALLERGMRADLLFSDLSMPRGLAGDELARRALRLRRGLKVLLTSGYAAALSGSPSQDFAILAKPYRHDEFARAIRAALDA
ncbi:MAG TPA: ATP-binding protein, partial [Stellaceae bacterium]